MRGPAPQENKRRRNADLYAGHEKTVIDDGELTGPALEGSEWSPAARAYWDTWRRSPQAKAFLATDWMRLRMLVPLVEAYLCNPMPQKLAEIRQNETLLGATHADRLRARIKVEKAPDGPAETPAGVTALDEYRRTLAG
jgi:hypothetical protein